MPNGYGDYARQNQQRYGHLAQYTQAPYSNNYNNRYYNPYSIFSGPEYDDYIPGGLTDPQHWDLAESFANARYRYDPVGRQATLNDPRTNYVDNAAAVKISGRGHEPVIKGGLSNPINIYDNSTVGYNSYPENKLNRKTIGKSGYNTALGHSERRVFADALDSLLKSAPYKDLNREGLYAPKDTARIGSSSTRDRDLDIFDRLYNNAGTYKNFLNDIGSTVNLWSERPPCNNRTGENCNNFLERILPENSEVGYITRFKDNGWLPDADTVKGASEQFRQAYRDHMERQALFGDDLDEDDLMALEPNNLPSDSIGNRRVDADSSDIEMSRSDREEHFLSEGEGNYSSSPRNDYYSDSAPEELYEPDYSYDYSNSLRRGYNSLSSSSNNVPLWDLQNSGRWDTQSANPITTQTRIPMYDYGATNSARGSDLYDTPRWDFNAPVVREWKYGY